MTVTGRSQRKARNGLQNMNHIPEVCAELALYRIMIKIDEILDHYSKDGGAAEQIEAALWKLLHELQISPLVTKEARRNHRIE